MGMRPVSACGQLANSIAHGKRESGLGPGEAIGKDRMTFRVNARDEGAIHA